MIAQPLHVESSLDDPAVILRMLPGRYRDQFRAEYATAVEHARDPEGYRGLAELLRVWRLRATAYSDSGYSARLAEARAEGEYGVTPAARVTAGRPHR
jgi:hypothetical protein